MMPELVFIGNKECEPCKKALPIFREFAERNGIHTRMIDNWEEIEELDRQGVLAKDDTMLIPTICSVDGDSIKDCITGFSDEFERKLEEMVGNGEEIV